MAEGASDSLESAFRSKREIGKLAAWTVSSAKPGNGVGMLRDEDLTSFWQSDGAQPHLINIQFQKKVDVQEVAIYVDHKVDESYTPNKISLRAGNSHHDFREIKTMEMTEPSGWVIISLQNEETEEDLRTFFLQIAIISNHQNGRDSHLRQIRIHGPHKSSHNSSALPEFTSLGFNMYATIR